MTLKELRQNWLRRRASAKAAGRGWAAVVDDYARVLSLGPGRASDHTRYALALQEAGQADESVTALRRTIQIHPLTANTHRQLALSLLRRGRNDEARYALIRAAMLAPGNPTIAGDLASLSVSGPISLTQALRAFQFSEDPPMNGAAPDPTPRLTRAARTAFKARKLDLAVNLYRRLAEAQPQRANPRLQLGHALKELGLLEQAETAYWQALALSPRSPEIHLQIGHLFKLKGVSDAREAALAAWKLQPGNPAVLHELEGQGMTYRGLMGKDPSWVSQVESQSAASHEAHGPSGLTGEGLSHRAPEFLGVRERALWGDLARALAGKK